MMFARVVMTSAFSVLLGLSLVVPSAAASAAAAEPSGDVDSGIYTKALVSCNSGGLVDKRYRSPTGVYGGGYIDCFRPFPDTALTVTVKLTRNGFEVEYGKDECFNATSCYASTDVVDSRPETQKWCAHVTTDASGVRKWSHTYCAYY